MEASVNEVQCQVSQIINRFEKPIGRVSKTSDTNEPLTLSVAKTRTEIISLLQDVLAQCNEESPDEDPETSPTVLPSLDSLACFSVAWNGFTSYLSALKPLQLKALNKELTNTTTQWLSTLFSFPDCEAIYTDDSIVKLVQLVIAQKYPSYKNDGFEALATNPPVFYASSNVTLKLLQSACRLLGIPSKNVRFIPNLRHQDFDYKLDPAALEALMEEDNAAQKLPLFVFADAGLRVCGHSDSLSATRQICNKYGAWLHLKGHAVSVFALSSLPVTEMPNSFSIEFSSWYEVLGLPSVILHNKITGCDELVDSFTEVTEPRCSVLPLWSTLLSLGNDSLRKRLLLCFESCETIRRIVLKYPCLRVLSQVSEGEDAVLSFEDLLAKFSNSVDFIESIPSCVLFQFIPNESSETSVSANYNKLNSWLAQIFQRDLPSVGIQLISLKPYGDVLKYCPFESKPNSTEDCNNFRLCLEQQLEVLLATVGYRQTFMELVEKTECLQFVEIENWAGLGGVRYVPTASEYSKEELNKLNTQLVEQLRNTDSAFSLGEANDNLMCVRFGMITPDTDVVDLLRLVETTGKEQEESWKFIDTMAEVVKKGIETATQDLQKESEDKLWQEGILRHVPVFGYVVNWWSPISKDSNNGSSGIKGRSLDLTAGVVESTENIYKYHMQNLPASPQPSLKASISPLPNGQQSD